MFPWRSLSSPTMMGKHGMGMGWPWWPTHLLYTDLLPLLISLSPGCSDACCCQLVPHVMWGKGCVYLTFLRWKKANSSTAVKWYLCGIRLQLCGLLPTTDCFPFKLQLDLTSLTDISVLGKYFFVSIFVKNKTHPHNADGTMWILPGCWEVRWLIHYQEEGKKRRKEKGERKKEKGNRKTEISSWKSFYPTLSPPTAMFAHSSTAHRRCETSLPKCNLTQIAVFNPRWHVR